MKILNTTQTREADQYTISHEPISPINLMERASRAFTDRLLHEIKPISPVNIFAGKGNNGGDALAVARMLHQAGYEVIIWIINFGKATQEFETNLKRALQNELKINYIESEDDISTIKAEKYAIDGIFGSGLNRPVKGLFKQIIDQINVSFCDIYSIDVPSGLFADKQNLKDDTIIKAKKTFTFQSPKLTFFFEENYIFTGDWEILNIELSELFIANQPVSNFYISNLLINRFKKIRPKISHKGTFGYGLLWAGNTQMAGAAMLASKASLKTGAGKITVFTSLENKVPLNVFCPEAVISINFPEKIDLFTAIAIGPGLGTENKTIENLRKFLKLKIKVPLVLDADALNILADNPELIVDLPANCILTPHPKEFKNMVKKNWANSEEKFEILKNFAKQTNCIIVLKGAYTAIALPDGELYLNNAGNSALAKAGTGDVLTGIILGLLCQGYSELEAAITAVYEHGKAAERFTEKYTMRSLLASELINYIQ